MIKRPEQCATKTRLNPRGETSLLLTDLKDFSFQNPKLKMFSHVRLLPGQELAWHEHHGECEYYYILRGQGIYNDNGEKLSVGPGDVTCTPDGTGHGLVNTGDADLEFVATILFD